MSNSVPEHTYVHTGPLRSVAVCTKLFRKLPINTQSRRKHSRHQWGYICLHVNCSSACLCNGAEHIHGQRSPLFPVNFGETDNDYLTVFLLHIRCAACSLWFKREGGIPNTAAHFLVWARFMRAWARLFAHLPADCAWARMNRARDHLFKWVPEHDTVVWTLGSSMWRSVPRPQAWKHPWMMRGDKLSENFCLFGWWTPRFPWRSFSHPILPLELLIASLPTPQLHGPFVICVNMSDMDVLLRFGEWVNRQMMTWFSGYCPESMFERGIKSQFNILNVKTLVKRVASWMSAFLLQLETHNWTPNGYLAMSVFHATCFHSNKTVVQNQQRSWKKKIWYSPKMEGWWLLY